MKVLQGIAPEELDGKLHVGQPDPPSLGTAGMQQLFDAHPNLNTEKINALAQAQNENNLLLEQTGADTQQQLDDHQSDIENPHEVTKAQVGLGNVDNTADANKPVSAAQAAALGLKADVAALSAHTSRTDNPHIVTKAQVGLGNVDNTADANKPISLAVQAALNTKVNLTEKGASNGVATLGGDGKVPGIQLPDSALLSLGETSATAYWGDRGKTAYDHSRSTGNPHETEIGDIEGLSAALSGKANASDVLTKSNATPFIPSAPYHPATKEYTDSVALEAGAVTSVFGRAGNVTAQSGDYTVEQVTGAVRYDLGSHTGSTVTLTDLPENPKLKNLAIYGKTVETGTGDKSPDNPYTITGAGESGSIPIVVSDGTNSQTVNIPVSSPLYSLPNGVRDEIDVTGGKIIRRVGKYILDGTGEYSSWTSREGEDTAVILTVNPLPNCFDTTIYAGTDGTPHIFTRVYSDRYPGRFFPVPIIGNENSLWNNAIDRRVLAIMSDERVGIRIEKSRLAGWDNAWTNAQKVDAFKAWLSDNPITVIYELKEPVIESIPPIDIPLYSPDCTITTTDEVEPELHVVVLNPKPVSDSWQLGGKMWNEYITKEEINTAEKILPATCTYSSGMFTLSGLPDNLPDIFTVRFKAPADFAEGGTFVIGSTTFTAKLTSQEPAPDELFKSGAVVTMEVDTGAETAFFKMGGGGIKYNLYCQPAEPVDKTGLWLKTEDAIKYKKIVQDETPYTDEKWVTPRPANMPQGRAAACGGYLNGYVYIFGGTYGGTGQTTSYAYNIETNTYQTIASLAHPRRHSLCAVYENELYILGGWIGNDRTTNSDSVVKYNPLTNTYANCPKLPRRCSDAAGCVVGSRVYVFGGVVSTGNEDPTDNCFWYDLITGESESINSFTARKGSVCTLFEGDIYLFGGVLISGKATLSSCKYTLLTDTFTNIKGIPNVCNNGFAARIGTEIYVFEGPAARVNVYHPASNSYRLNAKMPFEHYRAVGAAFGTNVYLFGGEPQSALVDCYIFSAKSYDVDKSLVIYTPDNSALRANVFSTKLMDNFKILFDNVALWVSGQLIFPELYLGDGTQWTKIREAM